MAAAQTEMADLRGTGGNFGMVGTKKIALAIQAIGLAWDRALACRCSPRRKKPTIRQLGAMTATPPGLRRRRNPNNRQGLRHLNRAHALQPWELYQVASDFGAPRLVEAGKLGLDELIYAIGRPGLLKGVG